MKRNWLMACGVAGILSVGLIGGLVILLVAGIFALTRPVVDASEQFLVQLSQGKIAEAYVSTAEGFRARQDEASFSEAVKQLGLTDFSSVSWQSRQIENQHGLAEGTVTTSSGGVKPVSIRLVQERGQWMVVGVRYGGVDLLTFKSSPPVPLSAELEQMVATTLLGFNQAVGAKDFTAFYGTLADVWKKETTPLRLRQIFQEFIDKNIDIAFIKDVKPSVAPPATVNDRGVLVIAGHFATQPSQVRFELEYAREGDAWKLSSIAVNVGKASIAE